VCNSVAAAVVPAYGEVLIRLLARSGLTTPLLPIRATIAASEDAQCVVAHSVTAGTLPITGRTSIHS
jgi:hypothetical protein